MRIELERLLPLYGKRAPSAKLRNVKHGADPISLTPFEARIVGAKKAKESSAQAKGSIMHKLMA